jgi:CubicO group peptidase (beta-lactamase class C family)
MSFEAYHGVTGAAHQTRFNNLSARGFRMISLSVYGDPGSPRYAAVWVQRGGAGWVAVHGVDAAGYQQWFDTWRARGYAPVLVSAAGTASKAVFAAVMEQGIAGHWEARHGLTSGPETNPGTFEYQNKAARAAGLIPRSVAIYGTPSDRRYAGVWHSNQGFTKWHVDPSDTAADYQKTFDAEIQLPGFRVAGWRPAHVTLSGDHVYCSVFRDDIVGEWSARHGLTAAQYQAEFDRQNRAGFYPICVQGGGSGSSTRYAAIFARQDVPTARQWTATGPEIPLLAGFDNLMQSFMRANAVRAAQLTIAKKGVVKLARAYTWAEPGYRITQPSDRFLLASCSKMFLCAAVQSLYDAKKLTPGRKVYPLLGFSGPKDARSDKVTIQQCLDHMGGWDTQASGYDPTYSMRQIAEDLKLKKPVTKLDVATYMYKHRKLDFAPGTNSKYSNYGYLLASAVVEKVTGKGFFDYLRSTILDPEKITDVAVSPTRASSYPADQAIAEDPWLGLSPLDLASDLRVPAVYGGDGMIKSVAAASCGLATSATAMAKFIRRHAVWGNGGRMAGAARSGSTPGTSTYAQSRTDNVDWAFAVNTRMWPPGASATLVGDLAASINNLLNGITIPDTTLKSSATVKVSGAVKVVKAETKATRKPATRVRRSRARVRAGAVR